jgi:hypothetical protein
VDLQWARGRWSDNGEWQWFQFTYPNFRSSPASSFSYGEVKAVLTPRAYLAMRAGFQRNSHLTDLTERTDETFTQNRQSYELAVGYRPNRWQLLKVGWEWLNRSQASGSHDQIFGVQLVTSIQSLSHGWR